MLLKKRKYNAKDLKDKNNHYHPLTFRVMLIQLLDHKLYYERVFF